jgi:SAM-dependent methyltransferase
MYARVYDWLWAAPLGTALAETVRRLLPGQADRILDVGAGTGLVAAHLSAAGRRVVCVDTSRGMLRRAVARRHSLMPVQARADALPFAGGGADAVLALNLLHLHPRPDAVLTELVRLVRPGGRLICSWPSHDAGLVEVAIAERRCRLPRRTVYWRTALRFLVGVSAAGATRIRRTPDAVLRDAVQTTADAVVGPSRMIWLDLPALVQTVLVIDL